AASTFDVETSSEPIRATVSLGVATCPRDGTDANELVHQADLAVYRAKLQGRNRVLDASEDAHLTQPARDVPRLVGLAGEPERPLQALRAVPEKRPEVERRAAKRPHATTGPRLVWMPRRLATLVGVVSTIGIGLGLLGVVYGANGNLLALGAIVALVGLGQMIAIEMEQTGTLSVSAVGALAGAAIVGPAAALPLAITMAAIEWSARRSVVHQVLFNVGALTLASLAAAEVFSLETAAVGMRPAVIAVGLVAGLVYFAVNTGLLSIALGLEGREDPWRIWRERFSWLTLHYAVYGFVAGVISEAYQPIGIWALLVF